MSDQSIAHHTVAEEPAPRLSCLIMDQEQAIVKARQFATTAYNGELEKITREFDDRLRAYRNERAAKGSLLNGGTVGDCKTSGRTH